MYILAATFNGTTDIQYFVARTKTALRPIMKDASDWRLHNDGWCDAKTPDSWKVFDHVVGELARVVV